MRVAGSVVVVEVGGVGLAVQVTPAAALSLRIGTEATLVTALIVRDDDLSLFGFSTDDELTVFDLLRGVTGVGPKSALAVLGTLGPAEVARAVSAEDDGAFRAVSGIGPKTAKLIVVSLADKLGSIAARLTVAPTRGGGVRDDVTTALVGLGWAERAAAAAVDEILGAVPNTDRSVAEVLRLALQSLGPRGAQTARPERIGS